MKHAKFALLLLSLTTSSWVWAESTCYMYTGGVKVKSITVKLTQWRRNISSSKTETSFELLIDHKDHPRKKLRQFLSCFEMNGRTHCLADCDQGGVLLLDKTQDKLTLENLGFTTSTSCGEEIEEEVIEHIDYEDFGQQDIELKRVPLHKCAQVSEPNVHNPNKD